MLTDTGNEQEFSILGTRFVATMQMKGLFKSQLGREA